MHGQQNIKSPLFANTGIGKGKFDPITGHKGPEG